MGTTAPRRPRHRALRYGLLCGVAIAVVGLANVGFFALNRADVMNSLFIDGMFLPNDTNTALEAITSYVTVLVTLGLAFYAGMRAAYYTGKTSAGALTGLIAGTIGSLGQMVIAVYIIASTTQTRVVGGSLNVTAQNIPIFLFLAALFVGIAGVATDAVLCAIVGAIGGLIGASRPRAGQDEQPLGLPSYAQFLNPPPSDQEQTTNSNQP